MLWSCAVTRTSMAVSPTGSAMASPAAPLLRAARVVPLMPASTVAAVSAAVGVRRTWVTLLATVAA